MLSFLETTGNFNDNEKSQTLVTIHKWQVSLDNDTRQRKKTHYLANLLSNTPRRSGEGALDRLKLRGLWWFANVLALSAFVLVFTVMPATVFGSIVVSSTNVSSTFALTAFMSSFFTFALTEWAEITWRTRGSGGGDRLDRMSGNNSYASSLSLSQTTCGFDSALASLFIVAQAESKTKPDRKQMKPWEVRVLHMCTIMPSAVCRLPTAQWTMLLIEWVFWNYSRYSNVRV